MIRVCVTAPVGNELIIMIYWLELIGIARDDGYDFTLYLIHFQEIRPQEVASVPEERCARIDKELNWDNNWLQGGCFGLLISIHIIRYNTWDWGRGENVTDSDKREKCYDKTKNGLYYNGLDCIIMECKVHQMSVYLHEQMIRAQGIGWRVAVRDCDWM